MLVGPRITSAKSTTRKAWESFKNSLDLPPAIVGMALQGGTSVLTCASRGDPYTGAGRPVGGIRGWHSKGDTTRSDGWNTPGFLGQGFLLSIILSRLVDFVESYLRLIGYFILVL